MSGLTLYPHISTAREQYNDSTVQKQLVCALGQSKLNRECGRTEGKKLLHCSICLWSLGFCVCILFVAAASNWQSWKGGDEQRDSFLEGRKLDTGCVSEKTEVRRNTRDQQLTAETEMCAEQFLLSES